MKEWQGRTSDWKWEQRYLTDLLGSMKAIETGCNPKDDEIHLVLISLIQNGLAGVKIERMWTAGSG